MSNLWLWQSLSSKANTAKIVKRKKKWIIDENSDSFVISTTFLLIQFLNQLGMSDEMTYQQHPLSWIVYLIQTRWICDEILDFSTGHVYFIFIFHCLFFSPAWNLFFKFTKNNFCLVLSFCFKKFLTHEINEECIKPTPLLTS